MYVTYKNLILIIITVLTTFLLLLYDTELDIAITVLNIALLIHQHSVAQLGHFVEISTQQFGLSCGQHPNKMSEFIVVRRDENGDK